MKVTPETWEAIKNESARGRIAFREQINLREVVAVAIEHFIGLPADRRDRLYIRARRRRAA